MKREGLTPDLIADLYAAAVDDELWPQFSTLLGKATGIEAVSVWVTERGQYVDFSVAGVFKTFVGSYREHFGRLDPWAASLARTPTETVMIGYEHMREDELVKTEFYNDWARHGGMYRPIGVKMRLTPEISATMGSDNPFAKTLFDASDKRRVQALVPHVKRALQLRLRRQQSAAPRANAHAAALNAFTFGVLVCDAGGRLVFANAAAEALARQGAGIVLGPRGKEVGALKAAEGRALGLLIRDATGGGAGGMLQLTGSDGATALLVLVTPLPRQPNDTFGPGHALVALRSARDRPAFTEATLAALFKLSPAQAAIAFAIYNGRTPEEIALQRGIKITTLRSHLAQIFLRTGAENQRDLVRLLGMLPPLQ